MIKINKLVKNFDGFRAVDGISFQVKRGEVFGLLGPNGAGKTTTIRIITGILKASQGSVIVGKYDIRKNPIEARQLMGIVPEAANAYMDISALDNLMIMGGLYGFTSDVCKKRALDLLTLFQLSDFQNKRVKKLSKGLKQRLIIAMALMSSARLLLLDEPTSGLDVESARLIRKIIRKLNQKGTTILLTTHNLDEANSLCDRIAIMNHGKIAAIDKPENLKAAIGKTKSIEVAFRKKLNQDDLEFKGVYRVEAFGDKYRLFTNNPSRILTKLVEYSEKESNEIVSLVTLGPSLEDAFIELTKD